jgi:hypothetical protein
MRVNVYTEELINGGTEPLAEIVTAEYVSSRTQQPMKNYGLRIFVKSAPELHYIPGRDDDRSAVTFWCGDSLAKVFAYWGAIKTALEVSNQHQWRDKVGSAAAASEIAESARELAPGVEGVRPRDPVTGEWGP